MKRKGMNVPTNAGREWLEDWQGRLALSLGERGYGSLREFGSTRPRMSYSEMVKALGGGIAPIQLMLTSRKEWLDSGFPEMFVRDCLVRYLSEYVCAPTTSKGKRESQAVSAFGAWGAALGSANLDAVAGVWRDLKARILEGWLPEDADEPALASAAEKWKWTLESEKR